MKVQTPFFVSLEACIIYSWHTVYMTHLQLNDLRPRCDFYTPACCFWHKATWQHRSSQSAQDQRKERNAQNGKKAGNERPVVVDVKPMSFTPHPHLFPPTDQNSDADAAHPCWWGPEGPTHHTVREMKLLYLWMFLLRISEHGPSTRSKRGLSSFTHLSGPRATTVAALGRFNSRAISPGGGGGGRGREDNQLGCQ